MINHRNGKYLLSMWLTQEEEKNIISGKRELKDILKSIIDRGDLIKR